MNSSPGLKQGGEAGRGEVRGEGGWRAGTFSWGLLAISEGQLSKAWGSDGVFPRSLGIGASRFCLEATRIWCL
jgi:hypothetical protein